MKVAPPPSLMRHYQREHYDPSRLIQIIDELIITSPDIPNSYRFMTSTGLVVHEKCRSLERFLENKTDARSLRVKNLLSRLLRLNQET